MPVTVVPVSAKLPPSATTRFAAPRSWIPEFAEPVPLSVRVRAPEIDPRVQAKAPSSATSPVPPKSPPARVSDEVLEKAEAFATSSEPPVIVIESATVKLLRRVVPETAR